MEVSATLCSLRLLTLWLGPPVRALLLNTKSRENRKEIWGAEVRAAVCLYVYLWGEKEKIKETQPLS